MHPTKISPYSSEVMEISQVPVPNTALSEGIAVPENFKLPDPLEPELRLG